MMIEKTSIKDLLDKMLEIDNAWNSEAPNDEFVHLFVQRCKVYQQILEQQALVLMTKLQPGDIFVKLTRNLMIDVEEEGNIFEILKIDDIHPVTGCVKFTQYEYKKGFVFAPLGCGHSVDPTFRMVINSNRIMDKCAFAEKLTTGHFRRFGPEEADALVDRGVKLDIHYCSELKDIKGEPLFTEEEYAMMREGLM